MPTRRSVERLIALTCEGKTEQALKAFYAEDVVVRENNLPPRIGLAASLARNQEAARWTAAVHEVQVPNWLIDGDRVVIEWWAEWSLSNGARVRVEELAWQQWQGEKIVFERFFYDPTPLLQAGLEIG